MAVYIPTIDLRNSSNQKNIYHATKCQSYIVNTRWGNVTLASNFGSYLIILGSHNPLYPEQILSRNQFWTDEHDNSF